MNRPLFALALVLAACKTEPADKTPPSEPEIPEDTTPDPTEVPTPTTDDTDTTTLPVSCTPPTLQVLADIPDVPTLEGPESYVASFEVAGDQLVGKFVRDQAAAEGALVLWQELVLRIPLNQRAQLVQFTLFGGDTDLAAWANNTGTDNQTGRYGPSLYFHESNIADNDADVCARLSGHRGTYDWTLIHEFGHLRQYADGAVDDFVETFGNNTGDGEGYPDDGAPVLDGEWVTSYAERAGGDEDAAETFTTYMMLDALPTEDSTAADKVRFMAEVPGYEALRLALRVTEPGGGSSAVPDAPLATYDLAIDNPEWLWGTWAGAGPNGPVEYVIEQHEVIFRETVGGVTEEVRYTAMRDDGTLATLRVVESNESFHFHQVAIADTGFSESFYKVEGSDDRVDVEREGLGGVYLTRL